MASYVDRVALVTGAGSGIGRSLALELARRGCNVALNDLHAAPLEPVAAEIRAMGRAASVHAFDVGDKVAWRAAATAVVSVHGAVHLLFNNAGVCLVGPVEACSDEDLEWQLRTNLYGVLWGCRALLPVLRSQPEAHIVNVSSVFGIVSVADNAAYCMSKHAVKALSQALEVELADTSVRVTSVHPGAIATNIANAARFREGGRMSNNGVRKLISKGLPPERAAQIILDAVERNRPRVLVGRDAVLLDLLQRVFPATFPRLLKRFGPGRRRRAAS